MAMAGVAADARMRSSITPDSGRLRESAGLNVDSITWRIEASCAGL
jgi:hypothetical protein